MAAVGVTGPAADWLRAHREDVNRRFRLATRRWPRIEGDAVLDGLARALPALAGPGGETLCGVVADLVILHAGRGTLANPGVGALLDEAFPAIRPALVAEPALAASLSNAVENLGDDGLAFALALRDQGPSLPTPAEVRDLGAVLAWRLGRAPLRDDAIAAAARLPPAVALAALGLAGWDVARLPGVLDLARRDPWADPAQPSSGWRVHHVGAFEAFGGVFREPPRVLPGGDRTNVLVVEGGRFWRVVADRFGAVCLPAPATDARPQAPRAPGLLDAFRSAPTGLLPDGTFRDERGAVALPELAGATSWDFADGRLAATLPDSFRIRVVTWTT
ncbi:MAG: hypothetical protein ACOZNI_33085 [Myxococcota bacterium]